MANVHPFPAVMPPVEKASLVAAPPYDVLNTAEASELVAENPLSFLRVGRSEIELPIQTDPYDEKVYLKARDNYQRLCRQAPLSKDETASFYVYSLEMDGRSQTGIVAAPAVDDYDQNVIKKHEKTRRVKEDDRTRHITTLRSQTGPVFLTYPDSREIDELVAKVTVNPPRFDFAAEDNVRHTGWRVPAAMTEDVHKAFLAVPSLYIADGHHRAASASRARATLRDANPTHAGNEEYNRFLAVIFPASQLRILPYNRIVKDLNGLTASMLRERIGKSFDVSPVEAPAPDAPRSVHMYLENKWWKLVYAGDATALSPVDGLDVSLLQDLVLAPLLGIGDPRTDERIDFIGGIRGTRVLEELFEQGEAAVAFSMYPTTVEQLIAISDAGEVMPPKSTWFEPKLRDGLFVHDI